MNDNNDKEENFESEEEVQHDEELLANKKKQEEIAEKKKEICHFRTEHLESLEISAMEPFYRTPLTNIIEGEDIYQILVELPGLDKKNVKITLKEGILEIIGEKMIKEKEKKEDKKNKDKKDKDKKDKKDKDKKKAKIKQIKGDYLRWEFKTANFYRCFYLPEDVSTEDIEATFKNGILQLNIPKKTAKISEKQVIEIK